MIEQPQQERAPRASSGRIRIEETDGFERPGFTGHVYLKDDEGAGVGVLEVRVHGSHPEKTVQVQTRLYRVEDGAGTFVIDSTSYDMKPGDVFIIRRGSTYSYQVNEGEAMKLFEVNVPLAE
jgi:mannose-6-phosphate isomerase-like protein (cupin superfamily)